MAHDENMDALGLSAGFSETARLHRFFLVPLTLVIMTAVAWFFFELYDYQQREVQNGVAKMHTAASDLYQQSVRRNEILLQACIEMLGRDEALRDALASGNRAELLKKSAPLFADFHKIFGITHMYFTRADRVNLLRVHQPERYGDVIDRHTTLEAERTGRLAMGVELGPLGTFTLRVVSPWYADEQKKHLIGYVELGVEVDHALEEVRDYLGMQTFVMIRKQFLKRTAWESGKKVLGHVQDWDRFPEVVISSQGTQAIPGLLAERIRSGKIVESAIEIEHIPFQIIAVPLIDASGRNVGQMVILVNVAREANNARGAVILSGLTALAIGGLLLGFFYWRVQRIGSQLESHRRMLADMAMRDGLTKLLNHRMFYSLLENEVARAQRYEKPLSLLMLDIDNFKYINDSHGHMAGDMILADLGSVIINQTRSLDSVCRYGGEEITVILPETDMEAAVQAAERIRYAIENHRFNNGEGPSISITVSIGVATFLLQENPVENLVAAADRALYQAKVGGRNRVCRG